MKHKRNIRIHRRLAWGITAAFIVVAGISTTGFALASSDKQAHQTRSGELASKPHKLYSMWPLKDAELAGSQLFKAAVTGVPVADYDMYWTTGNDDWNKMANAGTAQQSYKEITVNIADLLKEPQRSEQQITYIAVSKHGQELGRETMAVRIAPEPEQSAETATVGDVSTAVKKDQSSSNQIAAAPAAASAAPAAAPKPTAGIGLYVDPNSAAARQARDWRARRPADAAVMDKLAAQPQARWFGNWNGNVQADVASYAAAATAAGKMPVLVLYNIPLRHCSSGGAANADQYTAWIQKVVNGIAGRRALVVLEPDALALIPCLSAANQQARYNSLSKAVNMLKASSKTLLYIDAGHANWVTAQDMAPRLVRANIAKANGFSLNVANFIKTDTSVNYGNTLSGKISGKHFIIDTGRNGNGPEPSGMWCNPPGRAVGPRPTTNVAHAKVDAYLWVKVPGESDGNNAMYAGCNGGPPAGQWHPEYALGLMRRAGY